MGRPITRSVRMQKIRVLVKEPSGPFRQTKIENSLDKMQEAVGGYIEVVPMFKDVMLIVNEENNPNIMSERRSLREDSIAGPAIFCGSDGNDFRGLRTRQIESVAQVVRMWGWTV